MPFVSELLKYKNNFFVETGTYQGETVDYVINNGFKNAYSIELSDVFYYQCVNRFISNPNVKIFKGNSRYDLYSVIFSINSPITFWLDGHWSGVPNVGCDKELLCPVLYELDQIKNHHIKSHTIMVNDIRLMDGQHFEVKKEQIEQKIYEINPEYKIVYYNDQYALNDVLVAYIDVNNKQPESKICIHKYLTTTKTNPQPPGLGDFIRGTITLFNYSKQYGFNLYLDNSHEIFNLLENENIIQNNNLNETIELLPPLSYNSIDDKLIKLFSQDKTFSIMTNAFYTKRNNNVENFGDISSDCKDYIKNIFTPNKKLNDYIKNIYVNLNIDLNKSYSVIHLRFGDNFIRNDMFAEDLFTMYNNKINNLIKNNTSQQFILISDSSKIAKEIKKNNPKLFYWENKKIHIGDLICDDLKNGIMDTLADFFIMSNSNKIYHYAFNGISGFSKMVSLLYDIEYINIDFVN